MMNFHLPPIGGGEGLARISTGAIGKIRETAQNKGAKMIVEMPYQIMDKDICTTRLPSFEMNLLEHLTPLLREYLLVKATLAEGKAPSLADMILNPHDFKGSAGYTERVRMSIELEQQLLGAGSIPYSTSCGALSEPGQNTKGLVTLTPKTQSSLAPNYKLNLEYPQQPISGVIPIAFEFGSHSPEFVRSAEGEAFLAQQLKEAFDRIASFPRQI
jgi:hypothetical protein